MKKLFLIISALIMFSTCFSQSGTTGITGVTYKDANGKKQGFTVFNGTQNLKSLSKIRATTDTTLSSPVATHTTVSTGTITATVGTFTTVNTSTLSATYTTMTATNFTATNTHITTDTTTNAVITGLTATSAHITTDTITNAVITGLKAGSTTVTTSAVNTGTVTNLYHSGLKVGYTAVVADYTLSASNYLVNVTDSADMTLPTAVGALGRVFIIKNSTAKTIPIKTTSGQTIDGNASPLSATTKKSYMLISDDANWIIISAF